MMIRVLPVLVILVAFPLLLGVRFESQRPPMVR